MLGWKLISERELALQRQLTQTKIESLTSELAAAKATVEKLERLIDHERERIDSERERADRIADSLFQSNGLPPTSTTVVQEQQAQEKDAQKKRENYLAELNEIYGEAMEEMVSDGAEPLPAELAEAASG